MNQIVEMQIIDNRLLELGVPDYATPGAAAIDLRAMFEGDRQYYSLMPGETVLVPTGIAVKMPDNMAMQILSRSGIGVNKGIVVAQGTGLVDSDYYLQIFVGLFNRNRTGDAFIINLGDRVAQMMFTPVIHPEFRIVAGFEDNGRGGFGHTGVS